MNKPNCFRSSNFHMDAGDVLHMLFLDETGVTVDIDLWSSETTTETVPDAPTILDVSDITDSSFTANWYFNENTTGYYLDVATDSAFTAMVAGYNNLDVGNVNSYSIIGLLSNVLYYCRIRAYNTTGASSNSDSKSAWTTFDVVVIGTQTWALQNVSVNISGSLVYDGNEANRAIYGGMYDWSMIPDIEALYPGWHVPTKTEFETLVTFLGGDVVAGGHLKEAGVVHWNAPNTGADNTSGFTALPGGVASLGVYYVLGENGRWWTTTEAVDPQNAYYFDLWHSTAVSSISVEQKIAFKSIRLIKD